MSEWSSPSECRAIAQKLEHQLMSCEKVFRSSGGISGIVSSDYVNAQSEIERVLIRNVNEVIIMHPRLEKVERISEIPSLVQRLMLELETGKRALRAAQDKLVEAEVSVVTREVKERDELLEKAAEEVERLSHRLHETRAKDDAELSRVESELKKEIREKDKLLGRMRERDELIKVLETSVDSLKLKLVEKSDKERRLRLELDGLAVKLETVERDVQLKDEGQQNKIQDLISERENRVKELRSIELKLEASETRLRDFESDREKHQRRIEKDLVRMGKLMAQAQADMESMRELNQGLQSEVDDKRREIQMLKENMNTSLSEAVGRDSQLQKDLQGFERELDFLRMDANHAVSALQTQLVDTERKLHIAEEKLIESNTTIQALRDDMAIAEFQRGEDEKIEMEAEILYLRKTLGEVDKEISALKNFKLTERSHLDTLQRENQELKNQLEGSPTGTELRGLIEDAKWPIPEDSSSLSLASFVRGNVLAMIKHFDQLFRDMDLDIEYLRSQLEQALMQKEDSVAHLCLKVESVSSQLCKEISKRKSLQGWTAELCKKTTLLWDKVHSETLRLPAAVSHN